MLLLFAGNTALAQKTDTALVNSYLKQAEALRHINPDSTILLTQKALASISTPDYPWGRAKSDWLIAGDRFIKADYDAVLDFAQSGLLHIEPDTSLRGIRLKGDLIRMLGIAYGSLGNYELSLINFLESRSIYEDIGDVQGTITSLNNIGVVYIRLENFEEALKIFLELDSLTTDDDPSRVTIPVNLGFIYYDLGNLELAKMQLNRALNFPGNVDKRAYGLSNFKLGQIYYTEKNYDAAVEAFNASIQIYKELQNDLEQVQSLNGLAILYLELNDLDKSTMHAREALRIAETRNALPEKKIALEALYQIAKKSGDTPEALRYHEEYKITSDSLQNSRINEEIGRLTAEYEFKKRENELVLDQREKELESAAAISRQRVLLYGSIVIILFAVLIIFVMYRNFLQKQDTNRLLSLKNKEIQDQAEELKTTNDVKDRLLSIIAHDLRGPLSSLHGIITLIEMNAASQEVLAEIIPQVTKQFKYTSNLLNNLLQWAQSQMDGYRVKPEAFNIVELMHEKKTLLQTRLDEKNLELELPEAEYIVYADRNMTDLVLQNLISNAIKYCNQGDSITACITNKNGAADISIKDTGIGIPEDKLNKIFADSFYTTEGTANEKGTGLGLMLCKDFVERNQGVLTLESEFGKGTTISFTLPHPV